MIKAQAVKSTGFSTIDIKNDGTQPATGSPEKMLTIAARAKLRHPLDDAPLAPVGVGAATGANDMASLSFPKSGSPAGSSTPPDEPTASAPGKPPTGRRKSAPSYLATVDRFDCAAEYLSLADVAGRLKVCTKTVRRIIKDKDIPIMRVGAQIRIRADHLPLFMSKEW